jgi:AraC family transcriptional regulator
LIHNPRSPCGGLLAWRLKRALAYIDANLSNSICLMQLARAAGFSRMHFARQFRVSTGLRPHEYVLRKRVDRAKHLLLQSQRSVASIARESGFCNHSHFTNVFREMVGKPPAKWRRYNGSAVRPTDTFVQLSATLLNEKFRPEGAVASASREF